MSQPIRKASGSLRKPRSHGRQGMGSLNPHQRLVGRPVASVSNPNERMGIGQSCRHLNAPAVACGIAPRCGCARGTPCPPRPGLGRWGSPPIFPQLFPERVNPMSEIDMSKFSVPTGRLLIASQPEHVGGYRMGAESGYVQFNLTSKPSWLHRFGVRLVLGWRWVDAP